MTEHAQTLTKRLARKSKLGAAGPHDAWTAIAEANRIFGADGWSRETLELRNPANRERDGFHTSAYVAKVRVTIAAGAEPAVREAHGCGEGRGLTPFEAHDRGLKAAELDATLRALAAFGRALGLDRFEAATTPQRTPARSDRAERSKPEARDKPPQPQDNHGAAAGRSAEPALGDEPPGEDASPVEPTDTTDTTAQAVMLPKERRVRAPAHLAFVRTQPCLVCGRTPSDAHHLRFLQPRAMAKKVSDEFTVPLCRRHHQLLHQDSDEQDWWVAHGIDPVAIAADLWAESRDAPVPAQ